MKQANFRCNHCGHSFVYEDRLLRHKCKQMIRKEEFETPLGQAAWIYYQTWMKTNHKLVPPVKSFLHSKYYGAFMRFAKFVKDVRIPDPELYIRLMSQLDILPAMFTMDEIYVAYIEHLDKRVPPIKNAKITIETLFNIAEDNGVDISNVFDCIDPNELIQLLRQRKLSPWLLLRSSKFKNMLRTRMSRDQLIVLETIIRPKVWGENLKKHADDVANIDAFVKALDL
jgi:hypothetical protein